MRRVRRLFIGGAVAVAGVACGLQVSGIDPAGSSPDASTVDVIAIQPTADGPTAPDEDATIGCDAGGDFCDYCDPTLVYCVELDGGTVDRSMYHRTLDVIGTPSFIVDKGFGAIALDGSVGLSLPADPRTEPQRDETVEIVVRMQSAPEDGGRAGFLDRNGSVAMFYYGAGYLTCRELNHPLAPPMGNFVRATCVATKEGRAMMYLDGVQVERGDATAPEALATEPTMIGRDDFDGEAPVFADTLHGDIASVRIYKRALTTAEVARAAGLGP